jgi:hypothetical protein
MKFKNLQVASKSLIRFKDKAERSDQSRLWREIINYFEDWAPRANTGFGPEERF